MEQYDIDRIWNSSSMRRFMQIEKIMIDLEEALHDKKYIKALRIIKKLESTILQIKGE